MTDSERRRRVEDICDAALHLQESDRAAFVAKACGGDETLHDEVDALLSRTRRAEAFLALPLGALAAELMVDGHPSLISEGDSEPTAGIDDESWNPVESLDRAAFAPGTIFAGRYRIVSLIGRGGMGEVYRAEDLKLEQSVALKFLSSDRAIDPDSITRFTQEASLGRQVTHPNVARIYDIGEVDGRPYLSMEYIAGEDLRSLLRRVGRLSREKALEIARQLCAGLAAAHARAVIHRDLKPANVMIDAQGRTRITDFGLAIAIHRPGTTAIAGTPAYMAPEQLIGGRLSAQTDLYALGLILYELLTGTKLLAVSTLAERWQMARQGHAIAAALHNEHLDPVIAGLIQRCLEAEPQNRPESALAVAAALPGGDALAAALAAGVIPSAGVVAAHRQPVGKPGIVRTLGVTAVVSLLAVASQSNRIVVPTRGQSLLSGELLADHARAILARFGYRERNVASRSWYVLHPDYWDMVRQRDAPIERLQWFQEGDASGLSFVYRISPQPLVPVNPFGVVSYRDPPSDVPGMADVTLDQSGHLIRFAAAPAHVAQSGQPPLNVDWSGAFIDAGLDVATFEATNSLWTPPVAFDHRVAWSRRDGDTSVPTFVTAASFGGRPVYFSIEKAGDATFARQGAVEPTLAIAETTLFLLTTIALVGAALLAHRNIRLGRWDRPGTIRLALFYFCVVAASGILRADHVARLRDEYMLMVWLLGFALYSAAFLAIVYVAFEPFVRGQWPDLLTSWARVLAGRIRDPLVGRDVLIGALAGIAILGLRELAYAMAQAFGVKGPVAYSWSLESLRSVRHFFAMLLYVQAQSIGFALGGVFLMLTLRIALRRYWLSAITLTLLVVPTLIRPGGDLAWRIGMAALLAALEVGVLVRFGVVALMSTLLFSVALERLPVTFDVSQFYFGTTLIALAIFLSLLMLATRSALAGRPLVSDRVLET